MHVWIQRGGDWGSGPLEKNHKASNFLRNTGMDPVENLKATYLVLKLESSSQRHGNPI